MARQLGIDEVHAEVLPKDKADIVSQLKRGPDGQTRSVAMVGDGINDAPALAAADVGLAMSSGTEVAMAAAGITLMRGDPALVADAIAISRRTYSKIRQNLFWGLCLQRRRYSARGLWSPEPGSGRRGHGVFQRVGGQQCLVAATVAAE